MPQVPSGVITFISHPPYGVLTRELGFTLSAGLTQLQRIRGPVTVDAFGLSFDFFTIPAEFGYASRVHKDFELPIVTFAPVYTLFDGHDVYGPTVDVYHEGDLYYLDQLLPKRIDVWVQTGCVVTQFFLVAL